MNWIYPYNTLKLKYPPPSHVCIVDSLKKIHSRPDNVLTFAIGWKYFNPEDSDHLTPPLNVTVAKERLVKHVTDGGLYLTQEYHVPLDSIVADRKCP